MTPQMTERYSPTGPARGSVAPWLLLGAIALTGGVGLAYGQTTELFVSASTGDDSAAGISRENPLRTIRSAMGKAEPGTTVTLLMGWYEGDITLKPGVPGRPIVLRAERRGRAFIDGCAAVLAGWKRPAGFEYTYATTAAETPVNVVEVSTGARLRNVPSPVDVEYLAGTFHYDTTKKTIYIHPSDSEDAAHHTYIALPATGIGVTLADHTVVDGLVLSGFGDAAIKGENPTGAVVRNCIAYANGYAVFLRGGVDCVVRGNHFWNNMPTYSAGAQIHVTRPGAKGIVIDHNTVHSSPACGIRFYSSGPTENCVVSHNLIWGNAQGHYNKGNRGPNQVGLRNVSVDNRHNDFWAQDGGHNTFGTAARPQYTKKTDLLIGRRDWHFVDPAYHDYRLQADSPARGAAPDGSDLGAFPYLGAVLFVSPEGDDGAEGTSEQAAWRTLRHAGTALRAGQTLYVAPGEWGEPLTLRGLTTEPAEPTRIRIRGRGQAAFPGLHVEQCSHLILEDVVAKGEAASIQVVDSQGVELRQCVSSRPGGSKADRFGVTIERSQSVTVDHCAVSNHPAGGILIKDSADVEVVSSILASNRGPQIDLRGQTPGFWSDFNAFVTSEAAVGRVQGRAVGALAGWRALTGCGHKSVQGAREDFAGLDEGDFRVLPGRALIFAGRYAKPVGPRGALPPPKQRRPIERVEIVSTTRTSANITYWTPGRVTGTMIEWGPTPEYGQLHDRAGRARGEYETFHTVSLLGLTPQTTYHFRVGFRDHDAVGKEVADAAPIVWSDDHIFTTAATDPPPRRLHVSPDGDDANDGRSPQSAWRTLRKAAREAHAGDTVTLAPGRYRELLRPLQTGIAPDRRVTFRAERPLTVFLDGGLLRGNDSSGRSHCVQIMSKAWVSIRNLAFEGASHYDNGGYRGWPGYAGLVRISGSSAVEIDACVMDGRRRYMVGLVAEDIGAMPGAPEDVAPLKIADSVFLYNWYSLFVSGKGTCVLRNNALVRSLLLKVCFFAKTRLRNNIYQSLLMKKRGNNLFVGMENMDSDYNCFGWDAGNDQRIVAWTDRERRTPARGLGGWRDAFNQDAHSIEADPGYPLSRIGGFGNEGKVNRGKPLSIGDLILPPDSPCRGAGENGEDLGPRWQRFLGR